MRWPDAAEAVARIASPSQARLLAVARVYGPETWEVYELLDRSLDPRGPDAMLDAARTQTIRLPRMAIGTFVEFTGHARLGRRTKHLTRRLSADDVAIIDHIDLDRVSAEELLESGVRVVVNVADSASGRYPNPGPLLLVRGGVRLIDAPGAPLFDELSDGDLRHRPRRQRSSATARARHRPRPARARARVRARSTRRAASTRRCATSPTTRCASCATRAACSPRASTSRPCGRASATGTRSSSPAARATSATSASVRPYVRDFKPVLIARRRRRRRAARRRPQAGRDRRRHGLRLRPRAPLRRRARRPRLSRAASAPGAERLERLGVPLPRRRRCRGSARTWRCCSPTRRAPS